MTERVLISGLGLEYPGLADPETLLSASPGSVGPSEFVPHLKLGRKGLRYKDQATRLALCASQSAMKDARLPTAAADQREPESLGVIVSCNLGNLDTVCKVVDTIHAGGVAETSPLDLPNASSNVVSASVAIRLGCRAANLFLCNGATSGVDALHLGANLIRAGRARRIIAVGVEPKNPIAERLLSESLASWSRSSAPLRLGEGAAAVVLEAESALNERGGNPYAEIRGYGFSFDGDMTSSVSAALQTTVATPDVWMTPNRSYPEADRAISKALSGWENRPACYDFAPALGETYGLLGFLQAVAASMWLMKWRRSTALLTNGACWNDGMASLVLTRSPDARRPWIEEQQPETD